LRRWPEPPRRDGAFRHAIPEIGDYGGGGAGGASGAWTGLTRGCWERGPRRLKGSNTKDLKSSCLPPNGRISPDGIIGVDGERVAERVAHPDLKTFAKILGDFIVSSVAALIKDGVFRAIPGMESVEYYLEELTGLYGWPPNPEMERYAEWFRAELERSEGPKR